MKRISRLINIRWVMSDTYWYNIGFFPITKPFEIRREFSILRTDARQTCLLLEKI